MNIRSLVRRGLPVTVALTLAFASLAAAFPSFAETLRLDSLVAAVLPAQPTPTGGNTPRVAPTPAETAENSDSLIVDGPERDFSSVASTKGDGASSEPYAFAPQDILVVTKTDDTSDGACDADCSLREAIVAAQAGDTIEFASPIFDSPQLITLAMGQLSINKNLTITGPGAHLLTVSGNNASLVFNIDFNTTATLSGLTITGGRGPGSGGGGIASFGSLELFDSVVTGNSSSSAAGGGIICQGSSMTIVNSTISGNTAPGIYNGGGIQNNCTGTIIIANSTISGNSAGNNGGGFRSTGGTVSIINSTITNNSASTGAAGVSVLGATVVIVRNSIIAGNQNNTVRPDVDGPSITSLGNNLIGNAGSVTAFNQAGDQTGTSESPLDPKLDALANNGGPTPTHALQADSPAIDGGNGCVTDLSCPSNNPPIALTHDQRGVGRNGIVDIGAFEYGNTAPTGVSAGGPYNVSEGGALNLSAAATDPDGDDLTYSWDLNGDGTFGDAAGANPTLVWAQLVALGINDGPAAFNVMVRVSDGTNPPVDSPAASLTVNNTAPTLSISGSATVAIGATYTLNLSSSDPGDDTLSTWMITWGDGSPDQFVSGSSTIVNHVYASPGTYTISATATDEDGTHAAGNTVTVMATCTANPVVTSTANSGPGSLRQAIMDACSGSTITFDSPLFDSPQVITLSSELVVNKELVIAGRGVSLLSISGNNSTRVFNISGGAAVFIQSMTITSGRVGPAGDGGGIYVLNGALRLQRVALVGNASNGAGGGIFCGAGTLTIADTTISGNTTLGGFNGGGIQNFGCSSVAIANSTISGNTASSNGGGLRNVASGSSVTLTNVTITNNSAVNGAGGYSVGAGTVMLRNTIVAGNVNNSATPDVAGAFTSLGNNLIGNVGSATGFDQPGDQMGTGASPLDPKLNALANNGGPTQTHALQADSPAINNGNDCVTDLTCSSNNPPFALTHDQRGVGRDGAVDVGSFELHSPPETTITLSPPNPSNSTSATFEFTSNEPGSTFECSLDGAPFSACTSPQQYDGLSGGSHTFEVRATDPSGNTDPTPASYTWVINSPPTITAAGGITRTQGAGPSVSQIATVADADQAPNTLVVTVNGSGSATVNGVTVSNITINPAGQVSATIAAACAATNASFTLRVTDNGGQFAQATLAVSVTPETVPPVINPIANVVATLPNGSATSMPVSFPLPTATDNCSAVTVTTNPVSGSVFQVGTTVVTVTAIDGNGNTASATFTVTVQFPFTGFGGRALNPSGINYTTAGNTLPISFGLGGNRGPNVFAAGSPSSQQVNCTTGTPIGAATPTTTSVPLTFFGGQYTYYWNTNPAWAGTCRTFSMTLIDGSTRTLSFWFYNSSGSTPLSQTKAPPVKAPKKGGGEMPN